MEDASGGDKPGSNPPEIVVIEPRGDVILDVTFETSKETLKSGRKATAPRPARRPGSDIPRPPVLKTTVRVAYRVEVGVLRKHSKYFDNLLGDDRFQEAKRVAAAFQKMALRDEKPADLESGDLPWIQIVDDDYVSRSAGRELVFGELLRTLHGKETVRTPKKPPSMVELTTFAILADRFDCAAAASAYVLNLKTRIPHPQPKALVDDGSSPSLSNEGAIRQRILISWLLEDPVRFHGGTGSLILGGSSLWSSTSEQDDAPATAWWDLPDGLEGK